MRVGIFFPGLLPIMFTNLFIFFLWYILRVSVIIMIFTKIRLKPFPF
jgi:hypothetical protein